jgi:hypothetical protein
MNKEFSKILGDQMKHFTSSPSADKVRKVQSEIDDVKQVIAAAAASAAAAACCCCCCLHLLLLLAAAKARAGYGSER